VDSVWEQEKLEARKMFKNAARAKRNPQRPVHGLLGAVFCICANEKRFA
jgi:hypothetical protein